MPQISSIFVSNNGLADHIGKAQVMPYLSGLIGNGVAVSALTVENRQNWQDPAQVQGIRNSGIAHRPIWRKTGPWARLDRLAMPFRLSNRLDRMIRRDRPSLLHCRSYMPLPAILAAARRHGLPWIFDMRGFWIDQRIEGGFWDPASPKGRALIGRFRKLESMAFQRAAAIVVLTQDAQAVVQSHPDYRGAPVHVIPCSVDQSHFRHDPALRAATRQHLGIAPAETVVSYLGSASGLYRMDLVYRFYAALRARKGPCRMLFIGNHTAAQHIAAARDIGISLSEDELICTRVPHDQVPALLNAADMGLSFIVSTRSSLGVSATKVGEYLACGLPVVSNFGIGDIERIVTDGQNGAVLRRETDADIAACADLMAGDLLSRDQIKAGSARTFSLERATRNYFDIYKALAT
ncbi:glycosyltransferase [Thalassobius sp. S69A]|uniref:glycosyltransferase n=1 Tax=unclassified Thalassovita TaxID=2619711 RepID=UPI000C3D7E01|nr:hypothetical protein [Paracoccaceae bacterium]